MAEYQCLVRHFVAGGELVEVGDVASFDDCPGSAWRKLESAEQKEEAAKKVLEVATPRKPRAKKE